MVTALRNRNQNNRPQPEYGEPAQMLRLLNRVPMMCCPRLARCWDLHELLICAGSDQLYVHSHCFIATESNLKLHLKITTQLGCGQSAK
eukprot:5078155-Amphidinium_carterae.1